MALEFCALLSQRSGIHKNTELASGGVSSLVFIYEELIRLGQRQEGTEF